MNKIGYQPNFQAKFIRNERIMQITKNEISDGKEEEITKALSDLSKHHSNVSLLLSGNEDDGFEVTNLYNNKKVYFNRFSSDSIETLSNIKDSRYKHLFGSDKTISSSKANSKTNSIANKYFVKTSPDYEFGHIIDKSI